jgi:hypothetical protein
MSTPENLIRPGIALLVFSVIGLLAYRSWRSYPNLIPSQDAVRRIDRLARRQGISTQDAYIRWANSRLKRTRYAHLANDALSRLRTSAG